MNAKNNAADSCKIILYFMRHLKEDPGARITRALYQDLAWKARNLPPSERQAFINSGLDMLQERTLRSLGCADLSRGRHPRKRFDVGIVTILLPELRAVLAAVDRRPADS